MRQFIIQIAVPVNAGDTTYTIFLPTIRINADNVVDAMGDVARIKQFLPEGATYTMEKAQWI